MRRTILLLGVMDSYVNNRADMRSTVLLVERFDQCVTDMRIQQMRDQRMYTWFLTASHWKNHGRGHQLNEIRRFSASSSFYPTCGCFASSS